MVEGGRLLQIMKFIISGAFKLGKRQKSFQKPIIKESKYISHNMQFKPPLWRIKNIKPIFI